MASSASLLFAYLVVRLLGWVVVVLRFDVVVGFVGISALLLYLCGCLLVVLDGVGLCWADLFVSC